MSFDLVKGRWRDQRERKDGSRGYGEGVIDMGKEGHGGARV